MQTRQATARLILAALALAAAAEAGATSVLLLTAGPGRAQLLVDDSTLRGLRTGERSPEGVALVTATTESATLIVDGRETVLRLGERNDGKVTLFADRDRRFRARVQVNGTPAIGLIDTGAEAVTIGRRLATALGIDYAQGRRAKLNTVVGPVPGFLVTLDSVKIGPIELAAVPAVVADSDAADFGLVLVGTSFLGRVHFEQRGNRLTLIPWK
ncbi:MAG TPA: retropepsin-like aspartic protease [Burkholderiales bacterium]|nr:retropepsin-like aspartic protease [Burkholderiales bacterium]